MENLKLYKKLLEVQKKIKPIVKDEKNTAFGGFKYYDINGLLAEIKPILNEQGLIITQEISSENGIPTLVTNLIDAESGEHITSKAMLSPLTDAQKFGGLVTYMRRYTLTALFALEADDDDGNTATGTTQAPVKTLPAAKLAQPLNGDWQNFPITFGKHKGLTLGQVPSEYIDWLSTQEIKNPELAQALAARTASKEIATEADLMTDEEAGSWGMDGITATKGE